MSKTGLTLLARVADALFGGWLKRIRERRDYRLPPMEQPKPIDWEAAERIRKDGEPAPPPGSITILMVFLSIIGLAVAISQTGCSAINDAIDAFPDAIEDSMTAPTNEIPPGAAPASTNTMPAIAWRGPSYGSAAETAAISAVARSGDKIRWTGAAPSGWPRKNVKVEVQGIVCFFTQGADGRWTGGKFDWTRPGQTLKGTENIAHGYGGLALPAAGTRWAVMLVSVDGRQRSNFCIAEKGW